MELEAARLKREEEATQLVSAGFPLLHLPALANPHAVLVSQTVRLLKLSFVDGCHGAVQVRAQPALFFFFLFCVQGRIIRVFAGAVGGIFGPIFTSTLFCCFASYRRITSGFLLLLWEGSLDQPSHRLFFVVLLLQQNH